jgi:hypothetical protein
MMFIAFSSQGVFAGGPANELFSDVPYFAELSAAQKLVKQDLTNVRSRYVQVNFKQLAGKDLPEGAESIFLNLFDNVLFTAIKDRLEVRSANRFTWFGSIEGMEHGRAILVVENSSMTGNVTLPGGFYQVRPVGNGVHAIYEINQEAFPEEAPPFRIEFPDTSRLDIPLSEADDGSIIDVMVVYSDDIPSASFNIAAEIQLSIDETNASYADSLINQRLRLVHSAQVPYTETGNMGSDLDCITSKTDGCLDEIHTWRDDYGADVVSFWVESGNYCGIAWLMYTVSNAFESNAFSVVKRSCATGYYSFGHELGHNMGAHHDRYAAPAPGAYDYSHGYVYLPGRWRTIMAYNTECADTGVYCTRIQHWSNPNVIYGGVTTGVPVGQPDSADNAMTLNNTALTVANFRQSKTQPVADTKANGSDGPITITTSDNLSVTVGLASEDFGGDNADWWVVVYTPFGWFYYDVSSGSWIPGIVVTHQGPLFDLSPFEVVNMSGLPPGTYTFYFGIDMNMNGSVDLGVLFFDIVVVHIAP